MFGDTPLVMVESSAALAELVESLLPQPVIGLDTESDSFHHYQEKVCLIQISDLERDIIIDPLAIDDLTPLGELLSRPGQVKVLHGADYDVVCLKRDFGFRVVNIFDTMVAAQFLGAKNVGLADLIEEYFGHVVDKKYQRHDWSERPLEPEHLEYARGDTHWLPTLREVLLHKLQRAGRLEAAVEESRLVEQREWSGRTRHPADFLRTKWSGTLDDTGKRVLRALWHYRDEQARVLDRPVFRVMPDRLLIELAAGRPSNDDELARLMRRGSAMMRRHGAGVLAAVRAGLDDTTPLPDPPAANDQPRRGKRNKGPGVDRLLGPLKQWRNDYVEQHDLNPVAVASNQLLRNIAREVPATLEELSRVEGMRSWQVQEYGESLLGIVREIVTDEPRARRRRRGRRRRNGNGNDAP